MPLHTTTLELSMHEDMDIIDITRHVQEELLAAPFSDGRVTVFVPGSTGGVMTLELKPGLAADLREAFERLARRGVSQLYGGSAKDDNGSARRRAALVAPSLSVPFKDRRLALGVWQQIAFVDFDSRPRKRVLILQFMGE